MATVGTNSYISVADFKVWADLFGNDYSPYTDAQIEASTAKTAINFIEVNYKFKGEQVDESQSMQLPTDEVEISDINNAAAQAVWQDLNGYLFVAMESQSANGDIASEEKSLGSLSKSVSYVEGTAKSSKYSTSVIDGLLRPYLATGSGSFNSYRVL